MKMSDITKIMPTSIFKGKYIEAVKELKVMQEKLKKVKEEVVMKFDWI